MARIRWKFKRASAPPLTKPLTNWPNCYRKPDGTMALPEENCDGDGQDEIPETLAQGDSDDDDDQDQ